MAKKFKKILLLTAAVSSAAAAAVYFHLHKKENDRHADEEDHDDFSENTEKEADSSRNYVPLNAETTQGGSQEECGEEEKCGEDAAQEAPDQEASEKKDDFTPLAEQVPQAADKTEETVEEFFDEDDKAPEATPSDES